jgi:glycosyltransferase involved in cell wall biosynthesis
MTDAILGQSFRDFELILVDDGSTDNTLSVLRKIEKVDSRVRVFTKPNGGPSSARNLGLEKAGGKYIQFYDADDSITPHSLKICTDAILASKSDIVVSGWQIYTVRNNKYTPYVLRDETVSNNLEAYVLRSLGTNGMLYNLWNKLFRADIIHDHNLRFREDLRFGEDLLFALDYFKYMRRLSIIPDITYHYQAHSETSVFSSSSIVAKYREINDEAIVQFAGKKPSVAEYSLLQWIRWRWLVSYWSLVAGSSKKFGEKLDLIKQFRPPELKTARLMHIGIKKYLIQCTIFLARPTAVGALLLGKTVDTLRDIVRFIKTI